MEQPEATRKLFSQRLADFYSSRAKRPQTSSTPSLVGRGPSEFSAKSFAICSTADPNWRLCRRSLLRPPGKGAREVLLGVVKANSDNCCRSEETVLLTGPQNNYPEHLSCQLLPASKRGQLLCNRGFPHGRVFRAIRRVSSFLVKFNTNIVSPFRIFHAIDVRPTASA